MAASTDVLVYIIFLKRHSHLTIILICFNKFRQNWYWETWRNTSIKERQNVVLKHVTMIESVIYQSISQFIDIIYTWNLNHSHSFSFAFIRWTTRCTTRFHSLSFIIIRCHSLSLVVIRCTTRCHSLSFVVSRCHSLYYSLSLVVLDVLLVCLFIRDIWIKWFANLICSSILIGSFK